MRCSRQATNQWLKRLVDKARRERVAQRYSYPYSPVSHAVTNRKRSLHRTQYRKHAAEKPAIRCPSIPILFTNTIPAQLHAASSGSEEDAQKFDYEAELVIVIGRRARKFGGGLPQLHFRLCPRQ